jgi:hypothetical protein
MEREMDREKDVASYLIQPEIVCAAARKERVLLTREQDHAKYEQRWHCHTCTRVKVLAPSARLLLHESRRHGARMSHLSKHDRGTWRPPHLMFWAAYGSAADVSHDNTRLRRQCV